jgi:hypothetical protein
MAPDAGPMSAEKLVEMACDQYVVGLELAKANPNKGKL